MELGITAVFRYRLRALFSALYCGEIRSVMTDSKLPQYPREIYDVINRRHLCTVSTGVFEKVTKKNGLQCKGVCRTWAHFKCLDYTPGKIQDIKAGVIKVTCPCPNCETSEAKEVLTKPKFSCTNIKCPANLPPACDLKDCASKNPIPCCPSCMYGSDTSCKSSQSPPKCPQIPKCESPPVVYEYTPDPKPGAEESTQAVVPKTNQSAKKEECFVPKPKKDECCSCLLLAANQSQSSPDLPKVLDPIKKQEKMRPSLSDSKVPSTDNEEQQKMMYSAIKNLCCTVGNLSSQLKDLMCKLEKCAPG